MSIDNLRNINSDAFNKKDIIEHIKEYVKRYFGESFLTTISKGQLDFYSEQCKEYLEIIKNKFTQFIGKELPNFHDIDKKSKEISARANDNNKIELIIHSSELLYITFNIKINNKKIEKEYRLDIESNFKKPDHFQLDKNGWNKIRYNGWELEQLEKQTVSSLNASLNEIKEVVEYNSKILNNIEFNICCYDTIVNKEDDLLIQDSDMNKIMEFLCNLF